MKKQPATQDEGKAAEKDDTEADELINDEPKSKTRPANA